jgi:hypothetical protein
MRAEGIRWCKLLSKHRNAKEEKEDSQHRDQSCRDRRHSDRTPELDISPPKDYMETTEDKRPKQSGENKNDVLLATAKAKATQNEPSKAECHGQWRDGDDQSERFHVFCARRSSSFGVHIAPNPSASCPRSPSSRQPWVGFAATKFVHKKVDERSGARRYVFARGRGSVQGQ